MAKQPQSNMLMEYYDHSKEEAITLEEAIYNDQSRFKVKWTCKVGDDYEADYTEFLSREEAKKMFFKFMYTYVLDKKEDA